MSHDPSEIILTCYYMVVLLNIVRRNGDAFFLCLRNKMFTRIALMNRIFTVSFVQLNSSLLNKCLFNKKKNDLKILLNKSMNFIEKRKDTENLKNKILVNYDPQQEYILV